MVLVLLRRVLPAGLLLASLTWLACSPDSDIAGPTSVGEPNLAVTAGETHSWTTESGVTVTMRTLGALVGDGKSLAFGINDNDVVVGQAEGPDYSVAFQWTLAGGMTRIGVDGDGWTFTVADDINKNGVIVGSGLYLKEFGVGFRWDGESMQPLYSGADGPADPEVAYYDNTALGNRRNRGVLEAVVWESNSSEADPVFGSGERIHDANDNGDLVGVADHRAFMWMNYPSHLGEETQIAFDQLSNTLQGSAEGVNSHTQVVGYMWSPSDNRAFIWEKGTPTTGLPGLGGDHPTKALDINDHELIVGESVPTPDGKAHAVVWICREPVDLHPPEEVYANLKSSTANAINNNGLMTGIIYTWDRHSSAVVWTLGDGSGAGSCEPPTPEQQLDELKGEISNLADSGALSDDEANSMTKKVDNALKKIGQGKTGSAINKLSALINQINEFASSGNLTPDQAEPLLELAQGAIDGLRGG
jgi:uncharacterized membrane protein